MINFSSILTVLMLACTTPESAEEISIVSVMVSGEAQHYTFSVGIKSPDIGCQQYANWWEVISEEGDLIYRRILGHSHVNEQPFVRSGGEVKIAKNSTVIIRAHMNNLGYGSKVMKGTVAEGFSMIEIDKSFAAGLEKAAPQPSNCAF